MIKYYVNLFLLLVTMPLVAQNTVKMSAIKATDYGVAYSLPKTSIEVSLTYTKKTYKAGEFYQYSERYLNVTNPIKEDGVEYILDKIETKTKGIIDKSQSYQVEFKSNSVSPYVTLTKDGLICAINSDYTISADQGKALLPSNSEPLSDPKSFLSEEILRAGSSAKQAELIAKQIYTLRDSRNNILTGDADNMPPDGNAYQLVLNKIDMQEKALTAMFVGSVMEEHGQTEFTIVPEAKDIDKRVVARFSSQLGVVGANDLSGAPIYLSLTNKEPKGEIFLTPKEEKELEKKFSKGIIYNIPGKATLNITFNNQAYINTEIEVAQYGIQEVLTPQMFDSNKQPIRVIFYPELGSIKQIIQ